MSVKIRLARAGTRHRPFYNIVVADTRSPRDGRFIEKIGSYNPMLPSDHKDRVVLKTERVQHWLGAGALPTDRVARFLGHAQLRPMPVHTVSPKKSAPKAKAQERAKAAAGEAPAAPAAG